MGDPPSVPQPVAAPPTLRRAAAWSAGLNGGRILTNSVVLLVLAGLLGPRAFGTVAIATLYVLLLQLVFQQGLAPALIARADVDDDVLDVAFRLALLGSLVMLVASQVLADPLGRVFGNDDLSPVVRTLSLLLPMLAVDLVPEALTRRASDFRFLALRTNVSVLVGGLAGIAAALGGAGVWALVLQQLLTTGLSTAILFFRTPWHPRWGGAGPWRRRDISGELLRYSRPASAAAALQFSAEYVDNFVVGMAFGPRTVGLYRLAGRVVATLYDASVRSGQLALLPEFARRRADDPGGFSDRFLQLQRRTTSVTMPLLGILAGASAEAPALLGRSWAPASTALLLLALAAMVSAATSSITPALQAVTRPRLLAVVNASSLFGMVLAGSAAAWAARAWSPAQQLAAVAGARMGVALLVTLPVACWALRRAVHVGFRRFAGASAGGTAVALAAAAAGQATSITLAEDLKPVLAVSTSGVVAVATAMACMLLLHRRELAVRLRRRGRA